MEDRQLTKAGLCAPHPQVHLHRGDGAAVKGLALHVCLHVIFGAMRSACTGHIADCWL